MKKADHNRVEEIRRTHRKDWYVNIHFLLSIIDKQNKVCNVSKELITTVPLTDEGAAMWSNRYDRLVCALKELEGDK